MLISPFISCQLSLMCAERKGGKRLAMNIFYSGVIFVSDGNTSFLNFLSPTVVEGVSVFTLRV